MSTESTKNELLAESLFTAKVREMVKGYKDEILRLEEEVRNSVAENFKYLNMPEPGRISGIIEKHLSNMNAEILGIKEELTHFEMSKLYKPQGFDFVMVMRPYGVRFGDIWGRSLGKSHNGDYFENFFSCSYAQQADWANKVYFNFGQELSASFFSTRFNRLLSHMEVYQHIGGHHNANWDTNYIDVILSTSGSGSVLSRGTPMRGIGSVYGYGLPDAGYYLIDMRGRVATLEYFRMLRARADGSLTGEANSELRFMESTGSNNGEPALYTGDFMGNLFASLIKSDGTSNASVSRNILYSSGWWSNTIPSLMAKGHYNGFNYPGHGTRTDGMFNKAFMYYWTWRDELATTQDVKNVENILKTLIECFGRADMYIRQGVRTDPLVLPINKRLNPEIGFPKGCRHDAQIFKNPYNSSINAMIQSGNNLWHERYLGVSAAEAEKDRQWRAEAKRRGEPLFDMNEHCKKYYGSSLELFTLWGRFAKDQKTFHDAQALYELNPDDDKAKKNYETLKRWFYTKYDYLRDKSAETSVELFSDDIMKLINSTDAIGVKTETTDSSKD